MVGAFLERGAPVQAQHFRYCELDCRAIGKEEGGSCWSDMDKDLKLPAANHGIEQGGEGAFTNLQLCALSNGGSPRGDYCRSPCAACKVLRRRCTEACLLAPHFPIKEKEKFLVLHRCYGAANLMKILADIPKYQRGDAINSLAYEAQARSVDPVYGCVGIIAVLQNQIQRLQAELQTERSNLAGLGRVRSLSRLPKDIDRATQLPALMEVPSKKRDQRPVKLDANLPSKRRSIPPQVDVHMQLHDATATPGESFPAASAPSPCPLISEPVASEPQEIAHGLSAAAIEFAVPDFAFEPGNGDNNDETQPATSWTPYADPFADFHL